MLNDQVTFFYVSYIVEFGQCIAIEDGYKGASLGVFDSDEFVCGEGDSAFPVQFDE